MKNQHEQIELIKRATCKHYGITMGQIVSRKKQRDSIAFPRQVAMVLVKEFTGLTDGFVAGCFGKCSGSSVYRAEITVKNRGDCYPAARKLIELLREKVEAELSKSSPGSIETPWISFSQSSRVPVVRPERSSFRPESET